MWVTSVLVENRLVLPTKKNRKAVVHSVDSLRQGTSRFVIPTRRHTVISTAKNSFSVVG